MEKCQKCKKKIGLIYCNSCSLYYCLECDRKTHSLNKNKNHKRKNNTSTYINIKDMKKNFNVNINNIDNSKHKSPINYIIRSHTTKNIQKQDPNIRLIKKLAYNLENDLDNNINKNNRINNNLEYKNDFNKLYKIIRVANCRNNNLDVNILLNIIEEQDLIIRDLFLKVNFFKQRIKDYILIDKNKIENFYVLKDEKYFDEKLDIIHKIYEKEKQELIKEQEDNILKMTNKYNLLKEKYLDVVMNQKEKKLKNNEEIYNIIQKLKIDKINMNTNTNKLSKINDEFNIAEFCMNEHFDELMDKLGNMNKKYNKEKENIKDKNIKIIKYN